MKNFDLMPIKENLINALQKNLIGRNNDLAYFYELLLAQEGASSIAIDGRWGSGKTFFIKQAELLINAKNPVCNMDEEERRKILQFVSTEKDEEMQENCELAIYYDAWENDNDIDPIMSIVYEIAKQLSMNYIFEPECNLLKAAGSIIEAVSGKSVSGILESLKNTTSFSAFKEQKDLHEKLKDFFSEILLERANRLVIFVDELDRCKPNYAVQVLERIKHYFCDERITFVFAVNIEELQHTIKNQYGNEFNACRYLDRFFDIRVSLPPAEINGLYDKLGLTLNATMEDVCKRVIEVYHLELREITRYYRFVKTAEYDVTHGINKFNFSFSDGQGKQLILLYIVPLLIGLKIVNISLYHDFVSGRNSQPLIDVYLGSGLEDYFMPWLLNKNESYKAVEGMKLVSKEDKLRSLYHAIFVMEYSAVNYRKTIGEYQFNKKSKEYALRISSMLSEYADYQI